MKWPFILLLVLVCACKSKNPICTTKSAEVLSGATHRTITVKDAQSKITAIYDEGWDSLKGGAYLFYDNGQLKSYTFYQSKNPVYSENYDEEGRLTFSKGSPMVDRIINELSLDSAYVDVYFFKLKKSYQSLNIKINQLSPANYSLTDDTLYANMKTVTFGISTTNLSKIDMYSRIQYLDNCTSAEHVLSDSVFLVKDPHIGPAPPKIK